MAEALFNTTNALAMAAWFVLIVLPRGPLARAVVLYAGVGLLCLVYAIGLVWLLAHDGMPADFTLEGLSAGFAAPRAMAIGWTHYLALDLFAGAWIARDADAKGFTRLVQAPVLIATFMAGPIGLLVWLAMREGRARAQGRPA